MTRKQIQKSDWKRGRGGEENGKCELRNAEGPQKAKEGEMVVAAIGEIKASLSYGLYCCDKDYERQTVFHILGHRSLREANAGAEAETWRGAAY